MRMIDKMFLSMYFGDKFMLLILFSIIELEIPGIIAYLYLGALITFCAIIFYVYRKENLLKRRGLNPLYIVISPITWIFASFLVLDSDNVSDDKFDIIFYSGLICAVLYVAASTGTMLFPADDRHEESLEI